VLHEGRIRFDGTDRNGADRSVVLLPGAALTWPLTAIAASESPSSATPSPAAPGPAPEPARAASSPARGASQVASGETSAPRATASPQEPARATASPQHPARANASPRDPAQQDTAGSREPADASNLGAANPAPAAFDIDRVIADVANLRARRRYTDAAALLEQTLTRQLPTATHERLSYELGEIHTYQLTSSDRACRHWQLHRARFPDGRYTTEIDAAVRRLDCEGTTP
jgi:hypothetical protein